MNNEQIISEVLFKCQKIGTTVIVGGYIRNKLLGYAFNDVDLLTLCSPEALKELFPQLNWTEQGLGLGVTRMTYRGIKFEFSSCTEEEYQDKLLSRDFTVNTFFYDGEKLFAQYSGFKDIENKILKPTPYLIQNVDQYLSFSPATYIRAFRFTSLYNLDWSPELYKLFKQNAHYFNSMQDGRLQSEAYEILKGENVLRAFYYYEQMGLIPENQSLLELKDEKIPLYTQNLSAKIIYLSYLLGEQTVIDWLHLHHLSQKLVEEIQEYLPYLEDQTLRIPSRKLPFLILLKRYEYKDNKDKIKDFLTANKK